MKRDVQCKLLSWSCKQYSSGKDWKTRWKLTSTHFSCRLIYTTIKPNCTYCSGNAVKVSFHFTGVMLFTNYQKLREFNPVGDYLNFVMVIITAPFFSTCPADHHIRRQHIQTHCCILYYKLSCLRWRLGLWSLFLIYRRALAAVAFCGGKRPLQFSLHEKSDIGLYRHDSSVQELLLPLISVLFIAISLPKLAPAKRG